MALEHELEEYRQQRASAAAGERAIQDSLAAEYAAWKLKGQREHDAIGREYKRALAPVQALAKEVAVAMGKAGKPTVQIPDRPRIPRPENTKVLWRDEWRWGNLPSNVKPHTPNPRDQGEAAKTRNEAAEAQYERQMSKWNQIAVRAWLMTPSARVLRPVTHHTGIGTYGGDFDIIPTESERAQGYHLPSNIVPQGDQNPKGYPLVDTSIYLTVTGRIVRTAGTSLIDPLAPENNGWDAYDPPSYEYYVAHMDDYPTGYGNYSEEDKKRYPQAVMSTTMSQGLRSAPPLDLGPVRARSEQTAEFWKETLLDMAISSGIAS